MEFYICDSKQEIYFLDLLFFANVSGMDDEFAVNVRCEAKSEDNLIWHIKPYKMKEKTGDIIYYRHIYPYKESK
ncbi:TonB-dependent receptor protein [Paenibacillus amylolyticus]|uniref:TonB-dependent receptor protein n=1 Tax=Paenibacillus amylolyticus TaxID=1451 RepID=A0A100VLJ6_PAEAM|nr:TonB-dependent receptor protein [Paenibacillus amylolyticus]